MKDGITQSENALSEQTGAESSGQALSDTGVKRLIIRKKSLKERMILSFKRYWLVYLLILPGIISLIIFAYGPMILQFTMAFTDYRLIDGIFGSKWVWFDNFKEIFTAMPEFKRLITNTLLLSLYYFIAGFLPPLILAVMFFDLSSTKLRKVSQTIVYIPYFFSWVIVYTIVYGLLSNTGLINSIVVKAGGERVNFLMNANYMRTILVVTNIWKSVGWGTIIYLAAMTSIDVTLYDVAKLDGCGPLRRTFVVTLPGIKNITFFLLVLALGGILSGGNTEQILLFYSPATWSTTDTIGTWMYREGLRNADQFSLGAALSFMQSTVGMILVLIANKITTKYAKLSIW